MGRIIYKPHCSNCGAIINDEITYRSTYIDLGTKLLKKEMAEISPRKCSTCGELFEVIEIQPPMEI